MQSTNLLKRVIDAILLTIVMALTLTACGRTQASGAVTSEGANRAASASESAKSDDGRTNSKSDSKTDGKSDSKSGTSKSGNNTSSNKSFDPDSAFSKRDLEQTADLTDAARLTVADGQIIDITTAGTYLIAGTAGNCTIRVDLDDPNGKVQLVLDGVSITNSDFPAIYVVEADKCFITTTQTVNTLAVTGAFRADGETNTDAVIYSRDDVTFNGEGTLSIKSAKGNGISCKDDLTVTGGTYILDTALDSLEANDSIAISGGTFTITSQKDGLHSENDEDNTLGYIYIAGGAFTIHAKSDGIQGTTFVRIDDGTFQIKGSEGIEATCVEINGGEIDINGSDDGINASRKSSAYGTPTITVNGGHLKVEVGAGDTDALDANGDIIVNGGTIEVTQNGMSSFDYDGKADFNGGTIYINGTQVDTIPQSMFGPGGGGFPGGGGGFPGGDWNSGNGNDGFPGGDWNSGNGNGGFPGGSGRGGNGGRGNGYPGDNNSDES
jgi:hypothetical protein